MLEMHDLVIVGAGPAGLALAYYLRDLDLDIRILEANENIGGRTHSVDLAGAPVNTGAMFIYRGTKAEELARELGQETAPFLPTTYGIHYAGTTAVAESNAQLVAELPLSSDSKTALLQFMERLVAEYEANTSDGAISGTADGLASETVADRLTGCLPTSVPSSSPLFAAVPLVIHPSFQPSMHCATWAATSHRKSRTASIPYAACRSCRWNWRGASGHGPRSTPGSKSGVSRRMGAGTTSAS
jgi:hypothetical protein